MRTFELRCQCQPVIRQEIPDSHALATWQRVLEVTCRQRGCRCTRHVFAVVEPTPGARR